MKEGICLGGWEKEFSFVLSCVILKHKSENDNVSIS